MIFQLMLHASSSRVSGYASINGSTDALGSRAGNASPYHKEFGMSVPHASSQDELRQNFELEKRVKELEDELKRQCDLSESERDLRESLERENHKLRIQLQTLSGEFGALRGRPYYKDQFQTLLGQNESLKEKASYYKNQFLAQREECKAQQTDLIALQAEFYVALHQQKQWRFLSEMSELQNKELQVLRQRDRKHRAVLIKILGKLRIRILLLEEEIIEMANKALEGKPEERRTESPNVGKASPSKFS